MGIALVTVTKSFEGEEFSNTHGVAVGSSFTTPVSEGDLEELGGGELFSEGTTNPTSPAFAGDTWLLHAIVAFERQLTLPWVTFERLYVTDGRNNTTGATVFLSQPLGYGGLRDPGLSAPEDTAPGNVTLMINREPVGLSARVGRIFLRGSLLDNEVRFGGNGLVGYTDTLAGAAASTRVGNAVTESQLALYLSGGSQALEGLTYCIPNYGPAGSATANQLVRCRPVQRLDAVRPNSRQVRRGRRESPAVVALLQENRAQRQELLRLRAERAVSTAIPSASAEDRDKAVHAVWSAIQE